MKKILVPTDFSKPATIAVEVAADIAKKANAELTLLHVVEEAVGNSLNVEGQVVADGRWEDRLFTMKLIEKGKKQLTKLAEDARFDGIRVKQELRIGSPYHGMNAIITEKKVDLVVMGTAGRSDLQQMIIGS
ncbi:MAG TPA: universal stress protein, partial [Chryseolinea sp.]|nr:universal stress protein [Chryseolinea sp.]